MPPVRSLEGRRASMLRGGACGLLGAGVCVIPLLCGETGTMFAKERSSWPGVCTFSVVRTVGAMPELDAGGWGLKSVMRVSSPGGSMEVELPMLHYCWTCPDRYSLVPI